MIDFVKILNETISLLLIPFLIYLTIVYTNDILLAMIVFTWGWDLNNRFLFDMCKSKVLFSSLDYAHPKLILNSIGCFILEILFTLFYFVIILLLYFNKIGPYTVHLLMPDFENETLNILYILLIGFIFIFVIPHYEYHYIINKGIYFIKYEYFILIITCLYSLLYVWTLFNLQFDKNLFIFNIIYYFITVFISIQILFNNNKKKLINFLRIHHLFISILFIIIYYYPSKFGIKLKYKDDNFMKKVYIYFINLFNKQNLNNKDNYI